VSDFTCSPVKDEAHETDIHASSSFQGYQLNGNKNGYEMPANTLAVDGLGNKGNLPFQNGIQTPGYFHIPICDAKTFWSAWMTTSANPGFLRKRGDRCANYPCC
jgi:hypothetical protein